MKKFSLGALALIVMMIVAFAGTPVTADACYHPSMDLTTYDNGLQGVWAVDHFHRAFEICDNGNGTFNVSFVDTGWFETLDAGSPGDSGHVDAGVKGNLGVGSGASLTITGVLADPLPNSVVHDFRNDSPRNYFGAFFSTITHTTYNTWQWKFETCGNGTWVDNATNESNPSAANDITGSPAACQNLAPAAPTVNLPWNPGDGRSDPQPGDRIVVYCQPEYDRVLVYIVDDDSQGSLILNENDLPALLAAGPDGITFPLDNGGSISIAQSPATYFYVAYNGPAIVDGVEEWTTGDQGRFSKAFQCSFDS